MGELIPHSMTHATFDSATNIASSMYQTAMWSPILPFSMKTRPLEQFNVVLRIAQSAKKQVRKRDGNEKKQKTIKKKRKGNSTYYVVHAAWPRTQSRAALLRCLDSHHHGCSCVTPHSSSFLIPWVLACFRAKELRSTFHDKGPVTFGIKRIFAFLTTMIVVHGISSRSSKVQRRMMVGSFILHIHYRHIHSSALIS